MPGYKGLDACEHLYEYPLPPGQHLHSLCLDLSDQNEFGPCCRKPVMLRQASVLWVLQRQMVLVWL